ncbi:SDR family oxidoreductase [Pseudonocardia charpentierae]|uniref:SDR family oxidoreductase n=1 Tax=Pseudonocardia charpentierae TaxID=3075545 RepID=A0ABU2NEQ1_9PSEU|nr:SDR family oxidoreductase [Pseudonocardia sp. DSM 45834]MDT0352440.1 SDR family oxidoreductase [Pseudonocardia sp. DSM 45834]
MSEARRVVVTAGGGGIGLIIAKAFVAAGDRVHVCDVNAEAVERVTRDDPAITGTVCDIADRAAVERFVEEAVDELGGIDVLVNNAGIAGPTTSVENLDPDEWDSVLAVNLTGPFNVTRLAIPHLKKSGNGVIIMMSSVGGRFGYANRSTYATTKRALIALAETLALELGDHGVRVNTIAPGAVSGPRMDGVLQARAAATGRDLNDVLTDALGIQAIKRFADPQDIAELALFLAGEHATTITGQTFAIDGGAKAPQ